jgi:hypothetical protein
MGVSQPRAGIDDSPARSGTVDLVSLDEVRQGPARQELHDEDARTLVLEVVVDGDDMGMVQASEELGLHDESMPGAGLVDQVGPEHLDRRVASQISMTSGDDDAPRAPTDHLADLVPGERPLEEAPLRTADTYLHTRVLSPKTRGRARIRPPPPGRRLCPEGEGNGDLDGEGTGDGTGTAGGPPAPGWWIASDGNWYPPSSTPAAPASTTDSEVPLLPANGAGSSANRTRVMVIGGAVAVVIALVVGFLVLGGSSESTDTVIGDQQVPDEPLMGILADGEDKMNDAATLDNASLAAEAHCFLSKASEDARTANSFIRCGPVLFIDAPSTDNRWMTGQLETYNDYESGTVSTSLGELTRGAALNAREYLYRPDGIEPSVEEIRIPDPPPVATDYSYTTTDEIGVELDQLDGASLRGVDYALSVDGAATVERIGQGPEATVAPAGHTLLVVRYDLTTDDYYGVVEVAVEVDGVKQSVELPPGANTLVAVVEAGAEDIGLNVTDTDTNQTVSLLTGERQEGYPAVLYRPDRRIAVNDSAALTFTGASDNPNCNGEGLAELTLGDAELVWSAADSEILAQGYGDELPPPSEGDQAWLVVEIRSFESTLEGCGSASGPVIPAAQVVLVLEDGTEITGSDALTTDLGLLEYQVPADSGSFTLEIRPGDGIPDDYWDDLTYSFGGAIGEIPITFATD